jgi:FkbM family methyltransferase
MRNVIDNPRFTYDLVKRRAFEDNPLVLVDVGMRHGAEQYWNAFGDQLRVIGFEPDEAECERINASTTTYEKTCYPIALDRIPQVRKFRRRGYNAASNGFQSIRYWWTNRFGLGEATRDPLELLLLPRDKSEDTAMASDCEVGEISTTTLTDFAKSRNISNIDFLKVDVEGADLDVLMGSEAWLAPAGILGVKCEVRFIPDRDGGLFQDIYAYLYSRGYFLMDMALNRVSRRALPMPVAWEHENHLGEPIAGPTEVGQITDGDVLMMRDLIYDDFRPTDRADAQRILKAAALFELFNLPDCAAELMLFYREALAEFSPAEPNLDQLVPMGFDPHPTFADYVREQQRTVQRFRPNRATH